MKAGNEMPAVTGQSGEEDSLAPCCSCPPFPFGKIPRVLPDPTQAALMLHPCNHSVCVSLHWSTEHVVVMACLCLVCLTAEGGIPLSYGASSTQHWAWPRAAEPNTDLLASSLLSA